MIELPEAIALSEQLNELLAGKRVQKVVAPTTEHKFCWYCGDPAQYNEQLADSSVVQAEGFGSYAELQFSNSRFLCVNDGVNLRLMHENEIPKNHRLSIVFEDESALVFSVAMYGGIYLHAGDYDNEYYLKSRNAITPFAPEFDEYYRSLTAQEKPNLSAKAFLATGQRFPGIGNGVLQDILFTAGINPKRKLGTLSEADRTKLLSCIHGVISDMTALGGRDTERNLLGEAGGYKTLLSRNTCSDGCLHCGGKIVKEAYLGGSVYYCPVCQPL